MTTNNSKNTNEKYYIIHSGDLKYPSAKEFKGIIEKCPVLMVFNFKYKHLLELLKEENMTMNNVSRMTNLYAWNDCLYYRLRNVRDSYLYAITNYNRGFVEDYSKCTHKQLINRSQFNYYAEIYYYYYFSSRDIIAQILNFFYSIGKKEFQVHFNKEFISKIPGQEEKGILMKYERETKSANEFRNGFTHRYTPNLPDNRSEIVRDNMEIHFAAGKYIESEKIVENINYSLSSLSHLIIDLSRFVK
jgi:hypothetical protein